MRKYIVTSFIEVADSYENRKPDISMIRRLFNEMSIIGVIDKECFRGRIVLKIESVKTEVFEI